MAFNIEAKGNTHNIDVDDHTSPLRVLRDVLGRDSLTYIAEK